MAYLVAWFVHCLTASGAVCCLLATEAAYASHSRTALAWLVVAVLIDAVDGTLARRFQVRQVLPQIDGTLLDNLVDYLSYVFVPALLLHRTSLLPTAASLPIAAGICLASAYQFCQIDAKTPDHSFKGFPSYWNVVVLYLLALDLNPIVNTVIVAILIVMVFVPIKYLYLSRSTRFRRWSIPLTSLWAVAALVILAQLPDPHPWLVYGSCLYFAYYFGASAVMTFNSSQTG